MKIWSPNRYLERKYARRFERLLSSLTLESPVIGVLGIGYPRSLYKVYVRAAPGKSWWLVGREAGTLDAQPQASDDAQIRAGGKVVGPLRILLDYDYREEDGDNALRLLFARARALAAQTKGLAGATASIG